MVTPANEEQLSQCLALCHQENVPIFVLGRGSNVLVSDAGFRGVVIRIGSDFQNVEFEENMVMAQSGILLSKLSRLLLERELAGFEFASGIPGTLGGAIYMNAGAYGGEMKDLLMEVTAMDENGTCGACQRTSWSWDIGPVFFRASRGWLSGRFCGWRAAKGRRFKRGSSCSMSRGGVSSP